MPVDCEGAIRTVPRRHWRGETAGQGTRAIAVETPVAIVINGTTFAVLLASPENLADFGVGFAFSEGIVAAPADIESIEIVHQPDGIEVQMWIADRLAQAAGARRRRLAGPTGCGLCGIESLAEANRPPIACTAPGPSPTPGEILAAMAGLSALQPVGAATRAVHAAGFWQRGKPMLVREDVGRHNALDKLVGALLTAGIDPATGAILLTSRCSYELVEKTALAGCPMLITVSAPTSLAQARAEAAGLTLIALARADSMLVMTDPHGLFASGGSR